MQRQVDRLMSTPDTNLSVDYKSNRISPERAEEVDDAFGADGGRIGKLAARSGLPGCACGLSGPCAAPDVASD